MERNEPAAPAADDGTGIPADMVEGGQEPAGGADAGADAVVEAARRIGWRPVEEYRGPKDKWIDAEAFMAKVERETPIMRERLRTVSSEAERLRQEIADLKREKEEGWGELVKRTQTAEQRGWQYAQETVKAKMRQAVADADTATFDRLQVELDELERMKPGAKPEKKAEPEKPSANAGVDPVAQDWARRNSWFTSDEEMNSWAIGAERKLMKEKPHLSMAERLEEVTELAKKRFSEKFENSARTAPPAAARPGPQAARPQQKKAKTISDLDENAKAALAKLKRMNPSLTDEDYLKSYKWDK